MANAETTCVGCGYAHTNEACPNCGYPATPEDGPESAPDDDGDLTPSWFGRPESENIQEDSTPSVDALADDNSAALIGLILAATTEELEEPEAPKQGWVSRFLHGED